MDYGDVIYDQPNNDSFSDTIEEQLQYKACLAIAGAIQATSRECLYNDLKDVKVLVAGGVESFVISINYCQLNALSTFLILYHLVKAFMTHKRNRDLFSIAELTISNIFSFQTLYLNVRNLRQKFIFLKSITVFKNKLLCFIRPINCVRIWSHLLEKSLMEKFIFCAFENARRSLPSSSTYQALIHLLKICPVI